MNTFENNADRLLAVVGEGLPMTDACKRIGLSYDTARKWVSARRPPRRSRLRIPPALGGRWLILRVWALQLPFMDGLWLSWAPLRAQS
jgi:hypothetical protein